MTRLWLILGWIILIAGLVLDAIWPSDVLFSMRMVISAICFATHVILAKLDERSEGNER